MKSIEMDYVLVTEKWQISPEPKWVFHSERVVRCKVTPKRLTIVNGHVGTKSFNRQTGQSIAPHGTWYKASIKVDPSPTRGKQS